MTKEFLGIWAEIKAWSLNDPAPNSKCIVEALSEIRSLLTETKAEIERKQGNNTYANAFYKAGRLIQLKGEVETIRRTKAHLVQLHRHLTNQSEIIAKSDQRSHPNSIGRP